MIDRIRQLEETARQLEPSQGLRDAWNTAIQAYADAFINSIEERNAYDAPPEEGQLRLSIGEEGKNIEPILTELQQKVDRAGINPASGGHLGYVPGGGIFPSALGDYLAAVTNRYSGLFFANPGAVRIENSLIRWMCELVGYPEGSLGNLASGGSIANLIAITTARDFKGIKAAQVEKAVVYLTHQVHHCVQKALRIAGLSEVVIRYIPTDDHFRMDVECLHEQLRQDITLGLQPFLVVGSAGTTDTGAIDPLDKIGGLARQFGMWFHVDAAYGGFFLMVEELKAKFHGIERSDSVAIDPHKGLFLPYGLGAVLVKNVEALYNSHFYTANYMQDAQKDRAEWSPADLSPELTRHFRGLRMWLPFQLLGLKPFRAALAEKVALCQYFYQKIQELGFEVGPKPELSIMIFRYRPSFGEANHFNERLVENVRRDGRVFLSSTTIEGVYWIRLAVLSFRTHLREIELCLELLQAGLAHLMRTGEAGRR